jgi:hypothetical protein
VTLLTVLGAGAGVLLGCAGAFPTCRVLGDLGMLPKTPNGIEAVVAVGLACPAAGALLGASVAGVTAGWLAGGRRDDESPREG